MRPHAGTSRPVSLLLLRNSRALLAGRTSHAIASGVGVLYALIATYVGGMLAISYPPLQVESYIAVIAGGNPWWNYPAFLVETPYFVLALPFLSTVFMVLVSAGVGLGMTVAGILVRDLVLANRARPLRVAGISVTGLTPAMIALVTLGACCSTTAAASAGVIVVAAITGSTVAATLANSWYLGIFQLIVLWLGLVAQEQLVTLYGGLPGLRNETQVPADSIPVEPTLAQS